MQLSLIFLSCVIIIIVRVSASAFLSHNVSVYILGVFLTARAVLSIFLTEVCPVAYSSIDTGIRFSDGYIANVAVRNQAQQEVQVSKRMKTYIHYGFNT